VPWLSTRPHLYNVKTLHKYTISYATVDPALIAVILISAITPSHLIPYLQFPRVKVPTSLDELVAGCSHMARRGGAGAEGMGKES